MRRAAFFATVMISGTCAGQSIPVPPRELCLAESSGSATSLARLRPAYPRELLAAGVSGKVRLRVELDPDGRARDASVCDSSGNADLDASARRWSLRTRFSKRADGLRPGTRQAVDVAVVFDPSEEQAARARRVSEVRRDDVRCNQELLASTSFPRDALYYKMEGTVIVGFEIAENGDVVAAWHQVSSGFWELDRAAVAAVWKLRCSAGLPFQGEIPIIFTVSKDKPQTRPAAESAGGS